jgi:uncharacterized protein (TIGR02117 family)
MSNLVIFPVIFFFLNTSPKLHVDKQTYSNDSLKTIYLIKQRWHTAVVFNKKDIEPTILPEIEYFEGSELIDIGWGDEAFYQHPDFDWDLAYQALFYSTPSTLRIEGIYISQQQYFDNSEIVVELKIKNEQLKILLRYISDTIWKDENGEDKILSTQNLNQVYFFKANGEYYLFNTCNTWLAIGLKQSGFDFKDDIILTEQLFNEAARIGKVLKAD